MAPLIWRSRSASAGLDGVELGAGFVGERFGHAELGHAATLLALAGAEVAESLLSCGHDVAFWPVNVVSRLLRPRQIANEILPGQLILGLVLRAMVLDMAASAHGHDARQGEGVGAVPQGWFMVGFQAARAPAGPAPIRVHARTPRAAPEPIYGG